MAGVKHLNGTDLYSPGGKIAVDIALAQTREPTSKVYSTLQEDDEKLEFIIGAEFDKVENGFIVEDKKLIASATLFKSTGVVEEVERDKLLQLISSSSFPDGELIFNVACFLVNVAYYKNRYAYEAIKAAEIFKSNSSYSYVRDAIKSRARTYYLLIVDELDFFEKMLKTQRTVFDSQIDTMTGEQFISKFKDHAIPSRLTAKISDTTYMSRYRLNSYRARVIKILQYITEHEDGNNATLFFNWLTSYIDISPSSRSYQLDRFIQNIETLICVNNYNSKKLADYLTRQSYFYGDFLLPTEESILLIDYVKTATQFSLPYDMYPAHVKKAHDCMIKNKNIFERVGFETTQMFQDACEEEAKKYETTSGDFIVRIPREPKELFVEGSALNHCVGGYVSRVAKRETVIGFIRKKDDPDTPLYTIEIDGGKVIQAKGDYNADVPEEILALIEKIEKNWKKKKKSAKAEATDDSEAEETE